MAEKEETIPVAFKRASGVDDYEVFNCGISGVGLSAYLQFLSDAIPSIKNIWTQNEDRLLKTVTPEMAKYIRNGELNPYRPGGFTNEVYNLNQDVKLGVTISFFEKICKENDCQPILVYIPSRNQVTKYYYQFEHKLSNVPDSIEVDLTTENYQKHQQILAKKCSEHRIEFIDLTAIIKKSEG